MEYPFYYSTQAAPAASSTGTGSITGPGVSDRFGFVATRIIMQNFNAVNFYVNLKSTATASSADLVVRACSSVQFEGFNIGGYTAVTTSTGATAQPFNISAYASV